MPKKVELKITREKYDYYYNDFAEATITVCYLCDDRFNVARGISVLSKNDKYNEERGQEIAKENSLHALKGRKNEKFRRLEVIEQLILARCPFINKGDLNPELTWYEKYFVFGPKKINKFLKKVSEAKAVINGQMLGTQPWQMINPLFDNKLGQYVCRTPSGKVIKLADGECVCEVLDNGKIIKLAPGMRYFNETKHKQSGTNIKDINKAKNILSNY